MNIYTINKTTLIDFPGHLAASVYTGGCNMRCIYCHNAPLVTGVASLETISEDEFFAFLDKRKKILHGVCISGGEPTLSPDLPDFIDRIRSYDLKIKLDTNGTDPNLIKDLINSKKVDMIAMDIKSYPEDYARICGAHVSIEDIKESVRIIMSAPIDYEFRTTVPANCFSTDDMIRIGQWLRGAKAYFLQAFRASDTCMTQGLEEPSMEEMESLRSAILPYVPSASIRGID
ncbi:MAG: anaerobic ribonucleoside-triphosphate reductase activating protein [Lachnospiraceae bacterium]|nr:anaerobic ribonucleoside-triphosphate reductase activating protein [Lachnospiraceae bacterium]